MSKIQIVLIPIALGMLITACSDQKSPENKQNQSNASQVPATQTAKVIAPANNATVSESLIQENRTPSRNEMKVLTEQAKDDEDKIQNVIEQVNENLSDRESRKQAEAKLKSILPEYKEKMLLIAKAKLKEEQKQ
ncbi:hypothetical protein [Methylomonas sp. AM2-LC]|uniref:hypothetical protein n=1 Tax=Methylomonas sp. AM2-LC TaxID=3153301 RepID=UPI003266A595